MVIDLCLENRFAAVRLDQRFSLRDSLRLSETRNLLLPYF